MDEQVREMANAADAEDAVRKHCRRYHPGHIECVFAGDATGLSGSGMHQKAKGGYCFAFGVFFLDASVPCFLLHAAQRDNGSLKEVNLWR
jgi:hypothetical protein